MTVDIPTDLQEFVDAAVTRGEYASEGDVICTGLRLLQQEQEKHAQLKRDVQQGLEDINRGDVYDGETVFRELRERSAAARRST